MLQRRKIGMQTHYTDCAVKPTNNRDLQGHQCLSLQLKVVITVK